MITRRFPCRRALWALGAMMLAPLTACTNDDTESTPVSSPTARPVPRPAVTLSQSLAVGTPYGSDDPGVARVGDVTVTAYHDTVRGWASTGVPTWTVAKPRTASRSSGLGAAVDGDVTVITWRERGGDTGVRVIDTASGRLRWTYRTSLFVDTAARTVFASACNKDDTRCTVRALNPATGAVRWTHEVAGLPYVRLQDDVADPGLLAPAIGTKAILEVYTGGTFSDTSHLEILDVATGRTRPMPVALSSSSYARVGDTVAFAPLDEQARGCTGRVLVVDLQTGRLLWSRSYPLPTPTATSETLCGDVGLTALGNGVIAVHPADGRPSLLDIRTGRAVASTGIVTGDAVSRSNDVTLVQRPVPGKYGSPDSRTVYGVRSDGAEQWRLTLDGGKGDAVGPVAGYFVVGGEHVYDPTVVFRATTGAVVARFEGRLTAHGDHWFATWDDKVVRIYDVRG